MRLLALDTATESCGVGIAVDGEMQVELSLTRGRTHTRHLMEGVCSVLQLAKVQLQQIDAFAVTRGPGSFTGLRIGISTTKGLALALNKPLVGISSLTALAHQTDSAAELICPMIDARRREVYWTLFRRTDSGLEQIAPEQVSPAAQAAAKINEPCMFVGNGALAYRTELAATLGHAAHWSPEQNAVLRVGWVARLAWERLNQGQSDDVRAFGPVYLRKSDAELNPNVA